MRCNLIFITANISTVRGLLLHLISFLLLQLFNSQPLYSEGRFHILYLAKASHNSPACISPALKMLLKSNQYTLSIKGKNTTAAWPFLTYYLIFIYQHM